MPFSDLLQLLIGGLTIGSIYGLVAMGFHIVFIATGAINFATGEQVVLGGLLAVLFTTVLKVDLVMCFVLVAVSAAFLGLIIERLVVRPTIKISEMSVIIATIALSIIIQNVDVLIWGKEHISFPPFSKGAPVFFGGAVISLHNFWVIGLTALIVIVLKLFFDYTFWGKVIKGTANNMTAARIVGVNTKWVIAGTFALSSMITAFAGIIVAPITYAGGTIGTMLALKGFIAAILGGITSTNAVVLGGVLLGILEMLIAGFISSGYRDAIAIFILMVVLIIRPKGLFTFGAKAQ
jgi:branched-chain amino acid transport system permease protein